jgi:hypothetical protein
MVEETSNFLLKKGFDYTQYSYDNIAKKNEYYLKSWGNASIARLFFGASTIISVVKIVINLIACIFTGMEAIYTSGKRKDNIIHYSEELLESLFELIKGCSGLIAPSILHYLKETKTFAKLKNLIHYFHFAVDAILALKLSKFVLGFFFPFVRLL